MRRICTVSVPEQLLRWWEPTDRYMGRKWARENCGPSPEHLMGSGKDENDGEMLVKC